MNKRPILVAVVLLAVTAAGCKKDNSFDAEFERAAGLIAERSSWPESPEDVSAAFWDARHRKDYSEMHILWPGSASYNWPQMCAKDTGAKYVFGEARIITSYPSAELGDEAEVPYASQGHFKEHGTYNLTMKLRTLNTLRGRRWYVYSAN